MGASSSSPRTVQMENPRPHQKRVPPTSLEVSPAVVKRIQNTNSSHEITMFENEFNKNFAKWQKPYKMPRHLNAEHFHNCVERKRAAVMKCYGIHTGEPLMCANVAEDFRKYVFDQQAETILQSERNEDEEEEAPLLQPLAQKQ